MSSGRRGLFLDLDGTLADSLPALRVVHDRFMEEQVGAAHPDEFDALNGLRIGEALAWVAERHVLQAPLPELEARYESLVDAAYLDVRPHEGAHALVEAAARRGHRIAVVTSGLRRRALGWLEHVGLLPRVDCVIGGDSVALGKPDPAPYLEALARTGTDPLASLAVEDSPTGVRSALAAKIPTWLFAPAPPAPVEATAPGVAGCITRLDELIGRLADA